jgi:transcriptional regulator with XRE-family HTH domain
MADFTSVVRQWMTRRGMSLRGLAAAANYDPGLLSKVLNGRRPYSPYLAKRLDDALGAGGEIEDAAQEAPPPRPRKTVARPKASNAVEALQVAMTGDPDELDIAEDGLAELIRHYARAVAVAPSAAVHDELLSVRSFAGTLLVRARPAHPELVASAGWLSSLLAVCASDLGDHAEAAVWCADTERRGRQAGHPELLGWAALTRAVIAYYQGDAGRSAATARRGQADVPPGTVAYLKLASQEMRSLAMVGDDEGMTAACRRATAAMEQLGPDAHGGGIYSVPRAEEPPYTATSLLLAGEYREAERMTRRIIETAYRPRPGAQPTNYARTLLILALAAAGLGELDEADAVGAAALESGPVVWPTMVLAGKLDQSLGRRPRGAAHADFHERYVDAAGRLALPAAGKRA